MLMLLALVLALHLSASADRAPPPARRFRALWNQPWTEACQSHLPLPSGPMDARASGGAALRELRGHRDDDVVRWAAALLADHPALAGVPDGSEESGSVNRLVGDAIKLTMLTTKFEVQL